MTKFKPGDYVIGNERARYGVTKKGTKWAVLKVNPPRRDGKEMIRLVEVYSYRRAKKRGYLHELIGYTVDADCFDHIIHSNKEGKHLLKGVYD